MWNYVDYDTYLAHHGSMGMKWGVRRYQNADGSLTPRGQKRYNKLLAKSMKAEDRIHDKSDAGKLNRNINKGIEVAKKSGKAALIGGATGAVLNAAISSIATRHLPSELRVTYSVASTILGAKKSAIGSAAITAGINAYKNSSMDYAKASSAKANRRLSEFEKKYMGGEDSRSNLEKYYDLRDDE